MFTNAYGRTSAGVNYGISITGKAVTGDDVTGRCMINDVEPYL